jgi:hypothetical protein
MTDAARPSETPNAEDDLLLRAEHLIAWLIALARQALEAAASGPFRLGALRRLVREVVQPAEAALRRAIVLIAAGLPLPAPAPKRPPPARTPGEASPSDRAPRPPCFRLDDPAPRPAAGKRPARASTPSPAHPPRPPRDPAAAEARLMRRIEALERAFDNPLAEARRLQRRRARAASRPPRLSLGRIPGQDTDILEGEGAALLMALDAAAGEALREAPDSS